MRPALLALALAATGCGGSAVGAQYQALRVAATVYDSATDGAEAALNTQAAACNGDDACLDALREPWSAVRVAQSGVLLVLQSWASALQLWEAAGDVPALMRAAWRVMESLSGAWTLLADAGRGVGWDVPTLTLPRLTGGE